MENRGTTRKRKAGVPKEKAVSKTTVVVNEGDRPVIRQDGPPKPKRPRRKSRRFVQGEGTPAQREQRVAIGRSLINNEITPRGVDRLLHALKMRARLTDEGVKFIQFALSPCDAPEAPNIPYDAPNSVVTEYFKMEYVAIPAPSSAVGAWSVAILQQPCLPWAFIYAYFAPGQLIDWTQAVAVSWPQMTSSVNITFPGTNMNVGIPSGVAGFCNYHPMMSQFSGTASTNWASPVIRCRDPSRSEFRVSGMGMTSEMDVAVLNRKGMVYSGQMPRKLKEMDYFNDKETIVAINSAISVNAPAEAVMGKATAIMGLPSTIQDFTSQVSAYCTLAEEGNYVVSRVGALPEFENLGPGQTLMGLAPLYSPTSLVDSSDMFCLGQNFGSFSVPGTTVVLPGTPLKIMGSFDCNVTPNIVIYDNMDLTAIVKVKCHMGVESVVASGSTLSSVTHKSTAVDLRALQIVEQAGRLLPAGSPAIANDWDDVLLKVLGSLFTVLKFVI